jgi:Carboxypeptidase regulatory-like domain/TonB-dependent Receptor Plug Domain
VRSPVPCVVFRFISVVTLVLLRLSFSFGQEPAETVADKATIHGTVTGKSGAIVRDAKAVLTSAAGVSLAIPVSDKGVYFATGLYPGTYSLTVSASNFADQVFANFTLTPGKKLTLDATLEPAAAKPAVEAGGAEQIEQNAAPRAQKVSGDKGAINGMVTDQTGAVVTDAKAALASTAGEKLETRVNDKGVYSFSGLKPGAYTLIVTSPNFAVKTFDNITLTAGLELTLDASLEPAGAKTEVNVKSSAVGAVETESSTVSGTITQKEVVSIGLNGRNFTQLIALAPGVSNQTGQDEAKVGVVGSVKYSVNGGRVEYNTFEVDGSDVLNTGLNGASSTLMVYPSLDAIQEVKVLTSNYGAQYGRTASGTVQVTRSPEPPSGTETFMTSFATKCSIRAISSILSARPRPLPGNLSGRQLGARLHFIGGRISGERSAVRSTFQVFTTKKRTTRFSSFPRNSGENSNRVQPGSPGVKRAGPDFDADGDTEESANKSRHRSGFPRLRFQRRVSAELGHVRSREVPGLSFGVTGIECGDADPTSALATRRRIFADRHKRG